MARHDFAADLKEIDSKVRELFSLVSQGLAAATDAFLASDREIAAAVIARDRVVDQLYVDIEEMVQTQFALQAPAAVDMRYLLAMLRIVPELERSGDLVEHIAKRAMRAVAEDLSPRARGLIERMGQVGVTLWEGSAQAYADRSAVGFDQLSNLDDELDELHVALTAEIVDSEPSIPIAIEAALVARFFERLGDHAVNIAGRMRYVAIGQGSMLKPPYDPSKGNSRAGEQA
jgi:phosphate transport system protein